MAEEKMSDKRSMPPDGEVNLQELTVEQVEKMDDDELERIGQKKKKKTKRRKFEGNLRYLISAITICMSAYHLYTAIFSISPMLQRSYHLSFVLVLVFLLYPATTKSPVDRPSAIDWFLAALSVIAVSNVILNFKRLASTGGRGNRLDNYRPPSAGMCTAYGWPGSAEYGDLPDCLRLFRCVYYRTIEACGLFLEADYPTPDPYDRRSLWSDFRSILDVHLHVYPVWRIFGCHRNVRGL